VHYAVYAYWRNSIYLWFIAFSNFRKKWANLLLPLNIQKLTEFYTKEALPPNPQNRGREPLDPTRNQICHYLLLLLLHNVTELLSENIPVFESVVVTYLNKKL